MLVIISMHTIESQVNRGEKSRYVSQLISRELLNAAAGRSGEEKKAFSSGLASDWLTAAAREPIGFEREIREHGSRPLSLEAGKVLSCSRAIEQVLKRVENRVLSPSLSLLQNYLVTSRRCFSCSRMTEPSRRRRRRRSRPEPSAGRAEAIKASMLVALKSTKVRRLSHGRGGLLTLSAL